MISGRRTQQYVVALHGDHHDMIADLPVEQGGTDLGFDPHGLFEAALVACTVQTIQMYANRKQWPLESAEVTVRIDREGAQSHLVRDIRFHGPLDADQIARLLDIADKCPIHKLMTSQISVSTQRID